MILCKVAIMFAALIQKTFTKLTFEKNKWNFNSIIFLHDCIVLEKTLSSKFLNLYEIYIFIENKFYRWLKKNIVRNTANAFLLERGTDGSISISWYSITIASWHYVIYTCLFIDMYCNSGHCTCTYGIHFVQP